MLSQYRERTEEYLNDLSQKLVSIRSLDQFINMARGQLAGEAECIRLLGSLPITSASQSYPFTAITFTSSVGVQGVLNVRTLWWSVASGMTILYPRNFGWFSLYQLNDAAPQPAPPTTWSQFGQGVNGTIYLDNVPDSDYSLPADCVCYPIPLVNDTTAEAIPYQWTDAVPFFAAYLVYTMAQQTEQAARMMTQYRDFVAMARRTATPAILPGEYEQVPSLVRANQLGMQPTRGQAAS